MAAFMSSCQFKEEVLAEGSPRHKFPLIDSIRDYEMFYDVFDSMTGQKIGTENWYLNKGFQLGKTHYFEYSVYRQYAYDSSGGKFIVSDHSPNFGYKREIIDNTGQTVDLFFVEARNDNYYPEDSLSSSRFSEKGNGAKKSILTRSYRGVVSVEHKGKSQLAHHAGRDSSTNDGRLPPYQHKKEDYYYTRVSGLLRMTEAHYLRSATGDSLLFIVIKRRVH